MTQVHHLFPNGTPGIGHNAEPTFDDDIALVLNVGKIRTSFRQLSLAIRDDRLSRGALKTLECVYRHINSEQGVAWPGRKAIAEDTGAEIFDKARSKTIGNHLHEVRRLGYLDWEERRPTPSMNGKLLRHYVIPVARRDPAALEKEITDALSVLKQKLQDKKTARPSGHARPSGQSVHEECPPQRATETARPSGYARPSGEQTARPSGDSILIDIEPREEVVVEARATALVQVEFLEPQVRSLTEQIVAFIAEHVRVDLTTAREMLANNIVIYGDQVFAEAYSKTIAEKGLAKPYKYLLGAAANEREKRAKAASGQISGSQGPSRSGRVNMHKVSKEAF